SVKAPPRRGNLWKNSARDVLKIRCEAGDRALGEKLMLPSPSHCFGRQSTVGLVIDKDPVSLRRKQTYLQMGKLVIPGRKIEDNRRH
ncbi:hypothetical protein ANN_17915, partial [Periplaneta americana]